MSTIDRPKSPPLVAGQRLDRATFHARYEAMSPDTRAELIGGVVHIPSPLSRSHGTIVIHVSTWLGLYSGATPGVEAASNASVLLDDTGELQPDTLMRILPECGGQSRDDGEYVGGAPELIVEIARSSRKIDLGPKFADYERTGVREYVVAALDPDEVFWFIRRDDRFEPLPMGPDGLFRSEVFPGLWLDPRALFARDLARLIAILNQGTATPEHGELVARLAARRANRP